MAGYPEAKRARASGALRMEALLLPERFAKGHYAFRHLFYSMHTQ